MFRIKRQKDNKIFIVYGTEVIKKDFHLVTYFLIYERTWCWIEADEFIPLDTE